MKKFKKWMAIIGTKNLIAIGALLILVVAVGVGFTVSKNNDDKKDKEADKKVEESSGLQVEEDSEGLEGDSIDFGELFEEEEDKPSRRRQRSRGRQWPRR